MYDGAKLIRQTCLKRHIYDVTISVVKQAKSKSRRDGQVTVFNAPA